jgi:hypothetical protein
MNKPAPNSAPPQQQSRFSRTIPFLKRRAPSSASVVSTRSLADLQPSQAIHAEETSGDEADGIISDTIQRMTQGSSSSFAGDLDLLSDSNHLYTLLESYKNSRLAGSIRTHIESETASADTDNTRLQPYSLLMTYYAENAPSISLRRYFHELVWTWYICILCLPSAHFHSSLFLY